jgi:SAM-dependent methyltransferase
MKRDTFPVSLLCPCCRRSGAGGKSVCLTPRRAESGEVWSDFCSACGTEYPRVEGVRCLPPDLAAFWEEQSFSLEREPDWLPENEDGIEAAVRFASALEPDSPQFRETLLPAIYGLAHFPESATDPLLQRELSSNPMTLAALAGWLDRHPLPAQIAAHCALEVGCGPGRMLHELASRLPEGAIGLDLRLSMLRVGKRLAQRSEVYLPFRVEGRRFEPVRIVSPMTRTGSLHFVQGDITALPFEAGAFPLIASMSLIDVIPNPLTLLRDLDSLLAPGGLLLLAAPYHWQTKTTPPENWWSTQESTGPSTLRIALQGGHPALPHLDYEILETAADLPWALPGHRRVVHRYFLDGLLARKSR